MKLRNELSIEYNDIQKMVFIYNALNDGWTILINNKFRNIAESEIINNEVIYVIDGVTKKYTLYQKINIKLWSFTLSNNIFDKLKIEIL